MASLCHSYSDLHHTDRRLSYLCRNDLGFADWGGFDCHYPRGAYSHLESEENLKKTGESAVPPLIKAFEGDDTRIRRRAALGLAATGGPSIVDYLIKALKNDRWAIRCEAAGTLGRIGDAEAIQPLTESLKDDNQSVVAAAKLSLQIIKLSGL